jgi:histidine ammonia-lyase
LSELILIPGQVTLAQLEQVWRKGLAVRLADSARPGIAASAARIEAAAGATRGLWRQYRLWQAGLDQDRGGRHRDAAEKPDPVALLRRGRAGRAGNRPPDHGAEAAVAGRGASGVRPEVIALIEAMLAKGVTAGDPGAGLGRGLGRSGAAGAYGRRDAGRGRARPIRAARCPARGAGRRRAEARSRAGREGGAGADQRHPGLDRLRAGGAVPRLCQCARAALVVSALSTDAIMGSTAPFLEEIHTLRGHRGQILAAAGRCAT